MRTIAAIAACLTCIAIQAAQAQEFRVETDLFVGDAKEPAAQNLTIFSKGIVYDFPLNNPDRPTMFDVTHNRIVLFDVARRVQTRFTRQEIIEFIAGMKAQIHAEQVNRQFLDLADPEFVVQFNDAASTLTLANKRMVYRAIGLKPKHAAAAPMYRDFADWSARLNALPYTTPPGPPPFARMKLNAALDERGLVPEMVEKTVFDEDGKVLGVAHTRHIPNWILSDTDGKRIEELNHYLTGFQIIGHLEFFRK